MKLYTAPSANSNSSGGVFAVIAAHEKYLRALGVEYVRKEKDADLVAVHALAHTSRVDVFHSHGFYPTSQPGWGVGFTRANDLLIQTMMTARAVVSVSELAAEVMRRDFHIQPHIIRNGVDSIEIKRGGVRDGMVLWPKMNTNPTCDPAPVKWLAENSKFKIASMVQISDSVKCLGVMPRPKFLQMLGECSVYLGVTRENNPMAVMEAMSIGLPLVGYDWGFNREWLTSGNGCEMVEPGDLEGLVIGINKVLNKWREYSRNSRKFALANFTWDEPIQKIYDLYTSLLDPAPVDTVSVVIPLHNYARWIGEAVQSAKDQLHQPFEIIVVDDASTDSPIIPEGVKYIRLDKNQGVATARNIGIGRAKGNIILCLDADDMLASDYIQRALPHFKTPRVGVVYGAIGLTDEKMILIGKRWFDASFNYSDQIAGKNRVPTCAMFRKSAWERAGGFRKYETPAEDAGLWTRIASQGWTVVFLNDRKITLKYRMHDNSLSRLNKFPDWVTGREWKRRTSGVGYPVQMYDCPKVSFIMRYSIKDEQAFIQTVDSIEGLKEVDWEICASGVPTPLIKTGFPFVRWNEEPTSATQVFLEVGEVVTEQEWSSILANRMFP